MKKLLLLIASIIFLFSNITIAEHGGMHLSIPEDMKSTSGGYNPLKIKNPKYISPFDKLAIALGCGIKRKDVDDCVRRYLPLTIGSGPLTMEQINEIKKDYKLMREVVFAIDLMNRANSGSSQPSEEEQRQAQANQGNQQYHGYNPIAEKIWNKMGWTTLRKNPRGWAFSHTYTGCCSRR